jgi:DNA-binding NarL/FixJ family response regulator
MGIRLAGGTTASLESALAHLELVPADQVLVDAVKALAVKLDTIDDESLVLRYYAHYNRVLQSVVKRADGNRVLRLAAEAAARKAAEDADREDPLDRLYRERAVREAERVAYEKRTGDRVARLKAKGKTNREIADQLKCHVSIVEGYLADRQPASCRRSRPGAA